MLFACLTLFAPCMRAQTTAGDNSETLEWVLKTANLLEKRLNDAVADADVADLPTCFIPTPMPSSMT